MRRGFFIGLLLSGCALDPALRVPESVIGPYRRAFIEAGLQRGLDFQSVYEVSIVWGRMPHERQLGYCEYSIPRRIVLGRDQWQHLNDTERETLIFHELGHCYLYQGHSVGIMAPELLAPWYYRKERESLLDQLFKRTKLTISLQ